MSYRVEELAARAAISVDTIRYYQARNLLPAPARVGRVAWYGDEHVDRLAQIRRLQGRGFGLAVIQRLLAGELDRADEELIAAVAHEAETPAAASADPSDSRPPWLTIEQLAAESGIPLVVLEAVVREGLLVPQRLRGEDRYSQADVKAAAAGLRLLEHGLPLPELLELARMHTVAMRAIAERAVALFDRYIRQPLRSDGAAEDKTAEDKTADDKTADDKTADDKTAEDKTAEQLVSAFEEILPATLTIVSHHFHRTLLAVAQEHIERVGTAGERQLVTAASERTE